MKKALITGITGQDGSYLAEFLIDKGYEVHGIVRACSSFNRGRIDHLTNPDKYTAVNQENPILWHGDLTDSSSIEKIIGEVKPDEIYNLGAQSHVRISFDIPQVTTESISLGTLNLLEAMRTLCPKARFYQASSSEMFGEVAEVPQTEKTPFYPRSPYACAKVHAHFLTINYREAYGLHASNGILFNHESEKRGENFVTRKITRNLARIKVGLQHNFSLGNLDTERDWGYAKDYVEAMWKMLQQDNPEDYVIGTGEKHSVREFLEEAARNLDVSIISNDMKGIDEKYLGKNGKVVVNINPLYFRPTEVDLLLANPEKAREKLGWAPRVKFRELVKKMTEYDLELAKKEAQINGRVRTF
jgi:GDPmannose 4,6-dehydratase